MTTKLQIKFPGIKLTPRWETLQKMIREMFDDETVIITKISRKDKGCDYRSPGIYILELRTKEELKEIEFEVCSG